MNNARFAECLHILGWTPTHFCARLGIERYHLARWNSVDRKGNFVPVPDNVSTWLETLVAAYEANQLPVGWIKRAGRVWSMGIVDMESAAQCVPQHLLKDEYKDSQMVQIDLKDTGIGRSVKKRKKPK